MIKIYKIRHKLVPRERLNFLITNKLDFQPNIINFPAE